MNTKCKIINAADELFYQQGFESTSFGDIAAAVGITRGNFYHHFKSKEAILEAVIQHRLSKTQKMLLDWEAQGQTPKERISCFIHILIKNRAKISLYGCPVGSLTNELAKLDNPLLPQANNVFIVFAQWLEKQFKELGNDKNAKQLALHLLARSQGVATVSAAFRDEAYLYQEVELLDQWLSEYC